MENIEKLLEAFSKGLHVRHEPVVKEGEKPDIYHTHASNEVREIFKNALKEHLERKLDWCQIGESVTYNHFLGTVRNSTTIENQGAAVRSINSNLQEVMDKLPELPEGETYVFPAQTAVSVKVTGFTQDEIMTSFENVSSWLKEAMQ